MPNDQPSTKKPKMDASTFLEAPSLRAGLFALITSLVTFLFYWPTLSFDFVNLDDPQVILKNPLIHNLSWPGIQLMFTTFHAADWMPFTWLSFALNYRIADNQPWIYHLTNNILHALNTLLVFQVVRTLLRLARNPNEPASNQRPAYEDWTALLSALLFGLHPLHVESVAWITERKDVLYGFFYLASAQAYFSYVLRKDHSGYRYILCLTLFLCSLMSKTAAVTLPVVLLVLDLWPLGRFRKEGRIRPLLDKIPFFLISLFAGFLSLKSHEAGQTHLSWMQIILKPLFAFFFYLWKAIVPYGLSPIYPTLPLVPIYIWAVGALGLLFLGICLASFRLRRKRPGLFTALAFYLVTMAPNLAILVQAGHEGIAASDRYTYLPLLGFFVPLSSWAVGRLQRRPWALAVFTLALTIWLGTLTLSQAAIWKDGDSLWAGAAKIFPNSSLVRIELGNIALNADQFEEAKNDYEYVVRVQPGTQSAYRGLGLLALKQGHTDEAITQFQKALSINGHDPDVWVYLWKALTQEEHHQEALEAAKTAVQMDPDSSLLWNLLGSSYGYLGKPQEAVHAFQKALQLDRDNPDFLLNLGDTYLTAGKKTEAADAYRKALQVDPESEALQCLVGESYLRADMAKEALGPLQAAWEIKHAPRIAADLERAYRLLGQRERAKEFGDLTKKMTSHPAAPGR